MPKAFSKWLGLIPVVLLLAACNTSGSAMTGFNPVTPTSTPTTATPTSPQRTLEPTITPEPPVFGELRIDLIEDLTLTKAEYDQLGWPTSLSMPAGGVLFYALKCENMDSINADFFKPQDTEASELIIGQTCSGKSELLLVSPSTMGYSIGWLEDGMLPSKEEYFSRKGMDVDYTAFLMKGDKILIWYAP